MTVFTDKLLANLKPQDKRYAIWEENHRRLGTLGVRVSTSGRRTWIFMYRFEGRARMATLGLYPQMSVAAAHAAAGSYMEALERGHDPARERLDARRELQRSLTVEKLCESYLEQYAKRRKRTWHSDEKMLNRHVIPRLGYLKVGAVRRRDIIDMLEQIAAKAPTAANRVLEVVRKMYNWAVEREIAEINPCWRVSRPSRENQRDRVLSVKEIAQFWKALDMSKPDQITAPESADEDTGEFWVSRPVRLAFKLVLVTGQRRTEVAGAARSEFDLSEGWWTIPAERSKNSKAHRVPLSDLARKIVEELFQLADESSWLVPSRRHFGKLPVNANALSRAMVRIRDHMRSEHFHVHDLRRTAASHMAALGVQRTIIKKILNHADPDITAVYDRYSYDAEKRAALDAWANRLREIVATTPIELKSAA